jgi:tyrosinase
MVASFIALAIVLAIVCNNNVAQAQVPTVCLGTLGPATECCPLQANRIMRCGGPGVGDRVNVVDMGAIINVGHFQQWMTRFDRVCLCQGNFAGFGCDLCKYGWQGPNCDIPHRVVRRNVLSLSAEEQQTFIRYLHAMKNQTEQRWRPLPLDHSGPDSQTVISAYDFMPWFHYTAALPRTTDDGWLFEGGYAHEGSAFPTWHRSFLLQFEREMQTVNNDPNFALPFWDWTDEDTRDEVWQIFGGNGTEPADYAPGITPEEVGFGGFMAPGTPFANWEPVGSDGLPSLEPRMRRCVFCAKSAPQFPSLGAVMNVIDATVYDKYPWNSTVDCGGLPDSANCTVSDGTHSMRNLLEGFARGPPNSQARSEPSLPSAPRDVHNRVHVAMGGLLSNVRRSANDPLFFLHHCMVDLIFERWLRAHPEALVQGFIPVSGAPNGHNRDDCLGQFFPCITNAQLFKLSDEFGYVFDFKDALNDSPPRVAVVSTTLLVLTAIASWVFST